MQTTIIIILLLIMFLVQLWNFYAIRTWLEDIHNHLFNGSDESQPDTNLWKSFGDGYREENEDKDGN